MTDMTIDLKHRTPPGVSLGSDERPVGAAALRAWVTSRAANGGSMAGASLSLVDLSNAELAGADLATADLWAVDFDGAQLTGADLGRSDMRGARLHGTNLTGVNLRGTDLSGAQLDETTNLVGVLHDETTTWPVGMTPPAVAVQDDES
jgi:hypothetical protein